MQVNEIKENVIVISRVITDEIKGLCTVSDPSLLRQTTKDDLKKFTWKKVHDELKERTPVFLRFIEASVQNPSHASKKCTEEKRSSYSSYV